MPPLRGDLFAFRRISCARVGILALAPRGILRISVVGRIGHGNSRGWWRSRLSEQRMPAAAPRTAGRSAVWSVTKKAPPVPGLPEIGHLTVLPKQTWSAARWSHPLCRDSPRPSDPTDGRLQKGSFRLGPRGPPGPFLAHTPLSLIFVTKSTHMCKVSLLPCPAAGKSRASSVGCHDQDGSGLQPSGRCAGNVIRSPLIRICQENTKPLSRLQG